MPENNLVRTGIEGLDEILLGGIPRTNVILVRGTTGTGKTLLGVEFIYRGAVEFNEPGMIVVFETSPEKLMRDASTLGWKLDELQEKKKLQIVFTSPQALEQELRSPDSLLLETAAEMGAKRIFIDGIGLLRQGPSENGAAPGSIPAYRELLQQLLGGLHRENLTAMLSHETGTLAESVLTSESAAALVDTVIELNRVPLAGGSSAPSRS
jgi:RecA-superfamily ATPases implicated in signal transduction